MAYLVGVGDQVRVKTATGDERVVRVAQIGDGVVYVTTENEFQAAVTESRQPLAFIGYPAEDVRQA